MKFARDHIKTWRPEVFKVHKQPVKGSSDFPENTKPRAEAPIHFSSQVKEQPENVKVQK